MLPLFQFIDRSLTVTTAAAAAAAMEDLFTERRGQGEVEVHRERGMTNTNASHRMSPQWRYLQSNKLQDRRRRIS
jgi:hypothetical protein